MCGICGIYYFDETKSVSPSVLKRMIETLYPRGPDSSGFYINKNVGLGVQRLRVIDVETGDQPIHNEDETVWIVLNGEIYNFPDLKKELIAKGHRFYTKSDTEVIPHLYEEFSEKCVDYMDGMFAFCVFDGQSLFLARDSLGEKPLYYRLDETSFTFASELKSLLKFPEYEPEIDKTALKKYLFYGYVPAPDSIFAEIKKLLPGNFIKVGVNGEVAIEQYWNLLYDSQVCGKTKAEKNYWK